MRVIDLFSGCGGMSLGFQKAGFELVAAYEHWASAIAVYRENFDHPIFDVDLGKLSDYGIFDKHKPEMIIGGPPCQDFSSAGKRDESLGRADLTYTFAKIVAHIQPQWFVMENVDRIVKSAVLREAKKLLAGKGYGLTEIVLNASLCGVPQNRKRFFLLGELGGKINALKPYLEKNLATKKMTVYDYLGNRLGIEYYYRHPRSYKRRAIFSIYEPSPTIRGVNRPVPSTYQKHPGDAGTVSSELRSLTTKERSLIQTFPPDFKFEGSKTELEQMIGNAVSVNQAKYFADCILEYIKDEVMDTVLNDTIPVQLELL